MELGPIIYTSLLVVFSLLGFVLLFSFLSSRYLSSEVPRRKVRTRGFEQVQPQPEVATISSSYTNDSDEDEYSDLAEVVERPQQEKSIEYRVKRSTPNVERELIQNNKIRIVSKSATRQPSTQSRREILRGSERERYNYNYAYKNYNESISRYSVVNPFARDRSMNDGMYERFSKMSVEYSHTA